MAFQPSSGAPPIRDRQPGGRNEGDEESHHGEGQDEPADLREKTYDTAAILLAGERERVEERLVDVRGRQPLLVVQLVLHVDRH